MASVESEWSGSGTAAVVRSPPVPRRRIGWLRRAAPVGPVKGRSVRVSSPRRRAGTARATRKEEDGGGRRRIRRRRIRSRSRRSQPPRSPECVCLVQGSVHRGGALKDRRGRIGGGEASVTCSASTSSPSPDPNGFVDVSGVLTRPSSTRGALSSQVQPVKEVKGQEWKRGKELCMVLSTADRGAGNVPRSDPL